MHKIFDKNNKCRMKKKEYERKNVLFCSTNCRRIKQSNNNINNCKFKSLK